MARITGNDRDWPKILRSAEKSGKSVTDVAREQGVTTTAVHIARMRHTPGLKLPDGRRNNGKWRKRWGPSLKAIWEALRR